MAQHLKSALSALNSADNKALCEHIQFGVLLKQEQAQHRIEKNQAKLMTWKHWLDEHVHLSEAHVQKIKSISELFGLYQKFKTLGGLSFSQVYQLRGEIDAILNAPDCKWADFWKQP